MIILGMKNLALFFFGLFAVPAFCQTANQATLTLVDENGLNEADIDLDVALIGGSSDTSELSGTIDVQLNISPGLRTTDELTILSADVAGSDIDLSRNIFIASYSLESSNLGFDAVTPEAPGAVNPETGEFDATQHEVTINSGTLSGSATGVGDIDFNFAEESISGSGTGTGEIELDFLRIEGRKMYFSVTVELPLSLEESNLIEGSPVAVDAAVEATLKATGESFIELEDYATWATRFGLASNSENNFDLTPSAPNYFYFTLGFNGDDVPAQAFEFSQTGVTLATGDGAALGDLEIQWSSDLASWSRVPETEMTSGSSLILLGDSLNNEITVRRNDSRKFFRLSRVILD